MAKVEVLATPEALATTPNPGTTVWVPMWNLAGGSSNAYKGDWAAGTYYPGDHVVYNGILYECVRQTTAAPVPWPPAPGAASYGTTLPASPVDGQEAILVDNVTNPSYQWRFRWNAGSSSAYKWEFVGGAAWTTTPAGSGTTSSTSWIDVAGGPTFVIPRAGVYSIQFGAYGEANATGGAYGINFSASDGTIRSANAQVTPVNAQFQGANVSLIWAPATLAAAASVRVQVSLGTATSTNYRYAWLIVTPIRVS